MSETDKNKMFSCPRCGTQGSIFFVKAESNKVLIKQRCPTHGGRSFRIPLMEREQYLPQIREGIPRCFKCAQETTVNTVKESGPWTLIKRTCPIHGNKLPTQKIWTTLYNEISEVPTVEKGNNEQQIAPSKTDEKSETMKFCPNCGASLEGNEKFCADCGSKLNI
ncbi:MAG: zinc-ribbon domain-containing protein [Promethearchaeota archaeon]|jgi:rubredoxin